jgi:hypothetical protein
VANVELGGGAGVPPGDPAEPVVPWPVLPAFEGPCLTNVVPALIAQADRDGTAPGGRPGWMPETVEGARQIVLLVLDGLGWEQLRAREHLAPFLASGVGGMITSVAPSTTAAALTSLATGLPPAVHGVVGYRLHLRGEVLNVLQWRLDGADARRSVPPRRMQPFPAFPRHGTPTPVVVRADYAPTGFTAAHLGASPLHGWYTPSGVAVEVRRLVQGGERFVYAYYDGIDRVAHARGLGEHHDAELRVVDRLVGDVFDGLPPGAALVVTADHGQVEVGASIAVVGPSVMEGVVLMSGEGRFRWFHTRTGATDDVAAAAEESFGGIAWVRTFEQIVEDGWLGGEPTPEVAARLGDVCVVPFEPTALLDPADTGEQRLVARHGSLTAAEMQVPLLAWRA